MDSDTDLTEAGEMILPSSTRNKSPANMSHSKSQANTSQKTKTDEPKFIHDAGSCYIIFNYNIAIDKYCWNGMMMHQSMYLCVPCGVAVPVSDRALHIARYSHKTRLGYWPVDWQHLMRKSKIAEMPFCVACGSLEEADMLAHSSSEYHKKQVKQLVLACNVHVNRNFLLELCPLSSYAEIDFLVSILEDDQIIALNTNNLVFCKKCLQYCFVNELHHIDDHLATDRLLHSGIFKFYSQYKVYLDDVCAEIPS